MVGNAHLTREEAVLAHLRRASDTHLCRRDGVLANLYIVTHLNQVVELYALADDCRVGLCAVDTGVCANLHVILDDYIAQLRNLVKRAVGLGHKAKTIGSNDSTCVDDAVCSHLATLVNLHTRVEHGACTDSHAIAHIYLRIYLCASLHDSTSLDYGKVAHVAILRHRGLLGDRAHLASAALLGFHGVVHLQKFHYRCAHVRELD